MNDVTKNIGEKSQAPSPAPPPFPSSSLFSPPPGDESTI